MQNLKFKIDEEVWCDLDHKPYFIVWIKDRNEIEGLKGVNLLGNVILLKDKCGNKVQVYDHEISKKP